MAKKNETNKDLTLVTTNDAPAPEADAAQNNVVQITAKTKKYLYTGFSCVFTFGEGDKQEQKLLTNNTIFPLPSNDKTTKSLVRRGKLSEIKEKN